MSALREAQEVVAVALKIAPDDIKADDSITTYGKLDSVSFERLVLEIEERLDRKVRAVDFLNMKTVQDLADYLEKQRAG
ncbi:MAG: acyl carrier protein [Methylobacteriaceae bacterium]|jgi:acyl carrier protein|nr:acyl carrier protein [Methylobacteriaceae bacterium]